jgi:glycosyltransferase involved in cell wall biosynthesis
MTTVDVVVPCYNYARYLRGCVKSVLEQSGVDVRVLVIDDASLDDTPEVGRELSMIYPNVEFHRHEVNKGHISTYNEGLLEWSTSEYTVLLSADDMLAPGSLRRAVQIMDGDKTIGMVYGAAVHFHQETELPSVQERKFGVNRWSGNEWLQGRCRSGKNVITSPEVVVRGQIQRSVGGYRAELPHAGDLEMWLRIAAVSNVAYVRRVPQAFYRVHAKSMMRTRYQGSLIDLRQRQEVFRQFFGHHRADVEGSDLLYAEAMRSLAREALWDACRAYDRNDVEASQAAELEEFALQTCPSARSLSEYSALRRRRQLGPAICSRTQIFAAPALIRRWQRWALKQRWQRHGV